MKRKIPLAIVSIAVITLFSQFDFPGAGAEKDNSINDASNSMQVAMACGPTPNNTNQSAAAKGNFQISKFLSDEELSKFKYESGIWELGPGQSDTISHRHDCDVFVTVLEGTLLMGQEFQKPDTVRTGEIFHEHRNVIHSVSINPSKDQRMKAFVVYIRKDGRAGYTPLYPKK